MCMRNNGHTTVKQILYSPRIHFQGTDPLWVHVNQPVPQWITVARIEKYQRVLISVKQLSVAFSAQCEVLRAPSPFLLTVSSLRWQMYVRLIHLLFHVWSGSQGAAPPGAHAGMNLRSVCSYLPLPSPLSPPPGSTSLSSTTEGGACSREQTEGAQHTYKVCSSACVHCVCVCANILYVC